MSNFVGFQNKGEIHVNALKLLGASTKRGDDSKIGFFGSGLKYALAVLLREGVEFKIYSGLKEIKVGVRQTEFAGRKIGVITVNNEKTSMTIEAGIDWEPWFAIREIYSNTLDEGGEVTSDVPKPEAGITKIYVDTESTKFGDLFRNWKRFFATKRESLADTQYGRLLEKLPDAPQFHAYRRGILAYQLTNKEQSLFDYDLPGIEINESRVAKYGFQVFDYASSTLAASDLEHIKELLNLPKRADPNDYVEWRNEFWEYSKGFSKAWLEAIGERRLVPADFAGRYEITENSLIVPTKLLRKLRDHFGKQIETVDDDQRYKPVEASEHRPALLASLERLATYGYKYDPKRAHVVQFFDKEHYGMADERGINIAEKVFTDLLPETDIDAIVLEEIIHAQTGFGDFSRELQNHLFKTIIINRRQIAFGQAKGDISHETNAA